MQIVPLPAFEDNYIWTIVTGEGCVVVDPGEAPPVEAFLAAHALPLSAILVTHRHADHIGGIDALRQRWPVPVHGPASIAAVTHPLREGLSLPLPGLPLRVWEVPGHTEEHLAFVGEDLVFCGDTLFAGGCGRLKGRSTAAELHASLQRLAALPGDTRIYCTHEYTLANLRFAAQVEPGNNAIAGRLRHTTALRTRGLPTLPSLLSEELSSNPFLRTGETGVRAAAEAFAGQALATEAEVFAVLRAWKDVF